MIPRACKRLAEVDFPIAVVSKHAAREKSPVGEPASEHAEMNPLIVRYTGRRVLSEGLLRALERACELQQLPRGWNSHGAEPVSDIAEPLAKSVFGRVLPEAPGRGMVSGRDAAFARW